MISSDKKDENPTARKDQNGGGAVKVPSYWGIETTKMKIYRKDGTNWPWNCFMPWETYQADVSIDLKKHHVPNNIADKIAYHTVKLLRVPTDLFFQA
ncbi:Ubiquinol oxidase 2 [Cardamine amara subsp. amara]|uniref:Ubiquinol oxidase 2 n=1 Tax=Cardamine amara subsp. amara TaxID=228776 RepID=A0ABD1ABL4_CARAN